MRMTVKGSTSGRITKLFQGLLCAALVASSVSVACAGEVVGRITRISFHLDNWNALNYNDAALAQIYIEGLPAACGVSGNFRVVIANQNPLYSSIVAAAMAAQARGAQVRATYLNSCAVRAGSWDLVILELLE